MRFRRYSFEDILAADIEELAEMHANNLRAIQLLDFVIVACGASAVLVILDMLHV